VTARWQGPNSGRQASRRCFLVGLRWPNDLTLPGGHVEKGIFDADSHPMETRDWLSEFADEVLRRELELLGLAGAGSGERP
jgi:hypothetical protein